MELLVDLMPADTTVLVLDPERARSRAHDLVATSEEFLGASLGRGRRRRHRADRPRRRVLPRDRRRARSTRSACGHAWWAVSPFGLDTRDRGRDDDGVARRCRSTPAEAYRGDLEQAVADIRELASTEALDVVVVHAGHGPAQRFVELLGEHDIAARLVEEGDTAGPGVVTVTCGHARARARRRRRPASRCVTGDDLSGQKTSTRDMRKMPTRRKKQIDPLELKAGDYVVHEQHGVGRFVEMKQREIGGAVREYLVLEYGASKRGGPNDMLYVPADTLDQVTRYVGGENPSLDRLGGGDWTKRKNKARRAVREIAAELIKLYAARQATKGHAFGPDTPWQRELEDAFPFTETVDQLTHRRRGQGRHAPGRADGPAGLRRRRLRQDRDRGPRGLQGGAGRQAGRGAGADDAARHPAHVDLRRADVAASRSSSRASRASRPTRRPRRSSPASGDGSVDIVVGTHRLLNPDIKIKDLGLIIVDEEQRFGVEHKEQMKRMRTSVDVLSMSATPIPRTLEMAVTGIREMSTITTPPEERHPVLTYVGAYEDRQVVAAVRRELLREGQVFYIHNRVQSIEKAAARIRELVPEARVATAHGQMGEHAARAGHARLLGEALRRAGLHDHRRERPRRVQRQHDDHRALRHPRPLPAPPAARSRRPLARARLRLLPLPRRRSRSPRPPTSGSRPWPSTPTSAAAWRSR